MSLQTSWGSIGSSSPTGEILVCAFALFDLLPFLPFLPFLPCLPWLPCLSFCPFAVLLFLPLYYLVFTFWELFLLSIVSLHFYLLNFHFWAFILSENHSVMKVLSFCEGIDVGCGVHDFVWNDQLHGLIPPLPPHTHTHKLRSAVHDFLQTGHIMSRQGLAQNGQKCQLCAKFGSFGAKNSNFTGESKSFGTNITEKNTSAPCSHCFFGWAWDQMGQ